MRIFIVLLFFPFLIFGQIDFAKIETMIAGQQYNKAENVLRDYLLTHPKNTKGIELLGDIYGHQKNWDAAIAQYHSLVLDHPDIANYHYKYGGALGMKALSISKIKALGIIGDVKTAFITASELDPNHIEVRWALVELYMQLPGIIGGSKTKALHYANELENLSVVDGYLAKGYIYEYDKEWIAAEKCYKQAIAEGGSLVCYGKLTHLYLLQNLPDKAIDNLENAYQKHQDNNLNYDLGKVVADYKIYFDRGEVSLQKYIQNYTKKDAVSKAWAYFRLAQIAKHQSNKASALSYIDKALVESPKTEAFTKERAAILKLK